MIVNFMINFIIKFIRNLFVYKYVVGRMQQVLKRLCKVIKISFVWVSNIISEIYKRVFFIIYPRLENNKFFYELKRLYGIIKNFIMWIWKVVVRVISEVFHRIFSIINRFFSKIKIFLKFLGVFLIIKNRKEHIDEIFRKYRPQLKYFLFIWGFCCGFYAVYNYAGILEFIMKVLEWFREN